MSMIDDFRAGRAMVAERCSECYAAFESEKGEEGVCSACSRRILDSLEQASALPKVFQGKHIGHRTAEGMGRWSLQRSETRMRLWSMVVEKAKADRLTVAGTVVLPAGVAVPAWDLFMRVQQQNGGADVTVFVADRLVESGLLHRWADGRVLAGWKMPEMTTPLYVRLSRSRSRSLPLQPVQPVSTLRPPYCLQFVNDRDAMVHGDRL